MRKHLWFILFLVAAGAIWWTSISSTVRNPYADNRNPLIVVSGYVPYTLTRQLAGNSVNLLMLLPPGAEPHTFEPTPGALISLKKAAAFIYISDELEPWARDVANAAGKETPVLQLAKIFPHSQDPHVWMNPAQTDQMAQEITQLLAEIMPQNRVVLQSNYAAFADELSRLDQQFKTALASCASREVVHIGHLAFSHLANAYGLHLTALSGSSHNGEHSAKKLAALTDQIKAKHITTIFTEEMISPRLAQAVAQETGAQILPLYPIEHISKKDFNAGVSYTDLMRRNLNSLVRGLQCPA